MRTLRNDRYEDDVGRFGARRDPGGGASALTTGLLATLGVLMTTNPLTTGISLPALNLMADELDAPIAQAQLVFTGFLLGVAVGQLVIGMLSDSLGRRRVLLTGLGVLTATALCAAVAPNVEVLILLRVLQGTGAAATVVIARAVVSDLATGPQAARAYSVLMGILAAGPFVAPVLGTALMTLGGWRLIFVGLGAIGLLYASMAWFAVPETLAADRRTPVRVRAFLTNYRRLFRDRAYVANALAMAFGFAALSVHSSASSFITQEILGTGAWGFTVIYMGYALAIMAGSSLNAVFAGRFGARPLMVVSQGVALAATGALVWFATWGPFTVASFVATVLVSGAATSAVLSNASALTLARSRFAAASGAALMGFLQFGIASLASPVGGILGAGTPAPTAWGMLACIILSAAFAWRGRRAAAHGDAG